MRISLLALAALLLASALAAQDVAKTEEMPNYWPLKAGAQWQYQGDVGGQQFPITLKIAKIETIDGQPMARLESVIQGNVVASEHLASTAKGLFRHRFNGIEVTPPLQLLKYPVKEGGTWDIDAKIGGDTLKGKVKIGSDQVTVAAGKYKTITITLDADTGTGMNVKTTYWLAPNVGMVKQTVELGGKTIKVNLEKYEPAK